MAKLALDAAPAVAVPLRFLLTAPCWGMAAGVLPIVDADLLLSRWQPATLAATHAFTLGLLGNLLFGSLLQFLPAAAGVRLRGGARSGLAVYLLLNGGVALLTAGLYRMQPALLTAAACVVAAAFTLLAAMTAPGLLQAQGQRLLRAGLFTALIAALLTAALGVTLALSLSGHLLPSWPLPDLTDTHAAWGIAGWMLLTLGAVARVVMPMFQGTAVPPAWAQTAWLGFVPAALLAASTVLLASGQALPLRVAVSVAVLAFAASALWLQWRSPATRNHALRAWWRSGLLGLAAFALLLPLRLHGDLLAGVVGIGIALPLLAIGMQLEIVAFLGWLDLHRRCGRGLRVPGVHQLLPEIDKQRLLCAFLAATPVQLAAVLWPVAHTARAAGLATFASYALLTFAFAGLRRRSRRFLARAAA